VTYPIERLEVDGYYVQRCRSAVRVSEGGIDEHWMIKTDLLFEQKAGEDPPCRHCLEVRTVAHESQVSDHKWEQTEWSLPLAIEAFNEGGNANTVICLECILGALPTALQLLGEGS
jgi:hypothetical protein